SPSGSVPVTVPSSAELVPLWALVAVDTGGATPPRVHAASPFSKLPLATRDAADEGVTALDGSETGPFPFGLPAVTVNVYVVPLVSPVTVALVGAGAPDTTVTVCAVPLTYGVTV